MNTSIKMVIGAAVIVVIGIVGYYALRRQPSSPAVSQTSGQNSAESPDATKTVAATITYTDNGFTPATTTVKSGDTVKIINNSSEELQMDSDPHPAHTDDTELNVGIVSPGSSRTFVLKTKGNWGFHNHLNPGNTARVDVE